MLALDLCLANPANTYSITVSKMVVYYTFLIFEGSKFI